MCIRDSNMRAPGMTMMRLPLFTWMTFITAILLILAFPVITVALIELTFDRYFDFNFFNVARGGSVVLWQHLFWVFGHPEVYILILPAMGIVSEVLPVFSKKPLFGYTTVVLAGAIIAVMGWMVWSHHMFTVGLGAIANSIFAITTMLIAVPTGVKIFNWIATMWKGSIDFNKNDRLYYIGFIFLFIIGGLSGVMHSSAASDAQQQDTYFIVAHIHYVLFGGAIMALLGGVYFYFPKVTGKLMDESLGRMNFWLTFIGMNLTFFPMHFSGMDGMPRRIYTYTSDMGWDLWNLLSTFGVFIMGAGILIFVLNVVYSYIFGKQSGNDPWDARTIEWSISSPPPEYNFEKIPLIQSLDAFWEHKRNGTPIEPASGGSENSEEEKDIHLPQPSYWPMVVSIGIMLAAYGMIFGLPLSILGTIIGFIGVYAWSLEPVNEPTEH